MSTVYTVNVTPKNVALEKLEKAIEEEKITRQKLLQEYIDCIAKVLNDGLNKGAYSVSANCYRKNNKKIFANQEICLDAIEIVKEAFEKVGYRTYVHKYGNNYNIICSITVSIK